MKIHLEPKLSSCPDKLRCPVCQQAFDVSRMRSLLLNDRGLIQGDICPECVRLTSDEIRVMMADHARLMLEQPKLYAYLPYPEEVAMELFEASLEEVKFPSPYHWLVKTIESRFLNPAEDQTTIQALSQMH